MYQQPEKYLSKINHGKRSRFWNNSSTNMFFESIPTNRQVATTCLFCPNIVLRWKNAVESDAEITERNRMLKTLCLHMNISSNIIPDECSRSMFPFCYVCEELLNQLCESQETLDKAWLKISNVVSAIETAVAKGGIFSSATHTMRDTNQEKFTQLREMILESCRQRVEMEDKIFIRNSVGEMAHIKNEAIDAISTHLMFPSSPDGTTEKAANLPSTNIQDDQISESPLLKMIANADLIKQEIGIETTSMERGRGCLP